MSFAKIALLGPGLLGGSLALAVRARGLAKEIALYGRSENSLERARASGVASQLSRDPAVVVEGADLVILCIPIQSMADVVRTALPKLGATAIVTDVGSVKGPVVAAMEPLLAGRARWIGSHPMAGSEQAGFQAARADLFQGATAIVTPTPTTDPSALEVVSEFWRALGSRIVLLSPERHDELVAQISHLPHLVAAALVEAASAESLPLAGNGFRDSTRIAAGPAAMWAEIMLSNRTAMLATLGDLIGVLEVARAQLQSGDEAGLRAFLEKTAAVRGKLPASRSAP